MARPVILSNGSVMVGLNELGLVNDFYYPYVGLENLSNARTGHHKIGVWVENAFRWVDDHSWQINVDFESDALISTVSMHQPDLNVTLIMKDFVDSELNMFGRLVTVTNHADRDREIRVFMHQVFQISRAGREDTALYVPDVPYLMDYKGNCCLLVYGQHRSGRPFDQFAIGNYGIEGKEGTYKDAEDGILSCNPVEHGGVDSVLRFCEQIPAGQATQLSYWVIAADSQYAAEKYHAVVQKDGLPARLEKTRDHWQAWIAQSQDELAIVDDEDTHALTTKSMMIIKAHADKRGGILASGDSSIYNYGRDYYSYVWPRDAALALWPLIRLGYKDEARRFFEFCRDVIHDDGYLVHKFQPDRAIGSTWHPLVHNNRRELAIQEDETAAVIFMLGEYFDYLGDEDFVRNLYATLIKPAGNFMAEFIDKETDLPHASYDLWEQKFLTSTYTVAMTYSALVTASRMAEAFGFPDDLVRWRDAAERIKKGAGQLYSPDTKAFRKGFWLDHSGRKQMDDTIDVSSVYGAFMFGGECFDHDQITQAMKITMERLSDQSPSGGVIRYEHDNYFLSKSEYKGNPWTVCTLWLAQYSVQSGNMDKATEYLQWAQSHALSSGVMSEQVDPETGELLGVAPLVWSHAEFINTVLDVYGGTVENNT